MSGNSEDVISPKGRKTGHMSDRKYVTDNITISILARLPVKSLLRFLCVSKTWNALLRTPNFINEHHRMYNSNQNNNSSHLVYSREEKGERPTCTVLGENDGLVKSNFKLPTMPVINGYCDGLILIRPYFQSDKYYIWNPFVGIRKSIGKGEFPRPSGYVLVVGFGFAGRSGDYRVLKIRFTDFKTLKMRHPNFPSIEGRYWAHDVEMYSLAADTWTTIERGCEDRLPYWEDIYPPNVFFKGSIYFVAKLRQEIKKDTVLRFDLEEKVFSELALPSGNWRRIPPRWLTVLGGDTLALLLYDQGDMKMHVLLWLLNEESMSWTAQTHHFDVPLSLFIVTITKAGQIVSEPMKGPGQRRTMYIYGYDANHHDFKLTILETCHLSQSMFSHSVIPIYKESLFLIDQDKKVLNCFPGNPSSLSLIH